MKVEEMKKIIIKTVGEDCHVCFQREWNHYSSGKENVTCSIYIQNYGWYSDRSFDGAFKEVMEAL